MSARAALAAALLAASIAAAAFAQESAPAPPTEPAPNPFALDLGSVQNVATVLIDWEDGHAAARYAIEVSRDGQAFELARRIEGGNGGRDTIYLGRVDARFVRLAFEEDPAEAGYVARRIEAVPSSVQPNPNEFFHALAHAAGRGAYPRYWLHEQTYWTAIGADGDTLQALLSSDGQLEVGERTFTLEPFLTVDGRFVAWSNALPEATLADGALPIPSVTWQADPIVLTQTVFAAGDPGRSALYARYRLENRGAAPANTTLWLGIRPFQVNPPWQSLNGVGGATAVHHIERKGRAVWVNGAQAIALLDDPDDFGAVRFEQGSLPELIASDTLPSEDVAFDALGFASAAIRHRFALEPGASAEVTVAVPFHDAQAFLASLPSDADAPAHVAAALDATVRHWRARLAPIDIRLPPEAGDVGIALRAAVAQMLVARAGPVLRPGTRTYGRAWIRDGVMMGSALLQMGLDAEARDFLRWYLPFQDADGRVPCCVDRRGGDWAVEHDAPGQLIYGALSLWRYRRDVAIVRETWPNIVRAVDYIDRLRRQRLGPEYQTAAKRHFYGLLPESISHEGYSARPVHAYWDDFWALRGLRDAVLAARLLDEPVQAARFDAIENAFARDLADSIVATMQHHALDTIPASADLGDFDPSATSAALAPGAARDLLPQAALDRTYARYVEDFRRRRAGAIAWEAYTPYELRNIEALVRLGRRDDALFLLTEMLGDQRPRGWRQWGEIVWRDPTAPRFIGDVPHCWIASGLVRSVRAMLVYEREDGALVLGAGLPLAWLRGEGGVAVHDLPTHRGPLSYEMRAEGDHSLRITIADGVEIPREGIVVRPPVAIRAATIDGEPAKEWRSDAVTLRKVPVVVELAY